MAYAKQWNKLSEVPPPLDRQIYFLWTHPIMYGHIEPGCAFRRKLDDSIHYNYCFIGALEPTHWFIDESEYPPMPEAEALAKEKLKQKEPKPKTCLKCKHFVDENHTGFYAMGCKRDGTILPITGELDMSKSNCFEEKK